MSKLLILCILLILVVSLLSKTANDSLEYKLQSASGEDRINTFHKLAKQYIKSSPTKSLDFAYLELGEAIIQKDRLSEARAMINIAEAYIRLDDKDKAIEYYNTAIEIFYDMNEYSSVVSGLNKLGLIYKSIGEFEKAKQYFLRSLQIEEMNVIEKMKTIYLNQSEAYTAVGNEKKALEFYKLYASLKDSLAQKYSNERLADIQKYYEMETESIQEKFEEEKNSALLKKEKAIKELESKEDQYKSQIKEIISETEKIEKKIQNLEKDRVFSNLQLQQIRTKTEMKEQEIDILKQEKKIKELELSRQRRQKTSLIIFSVLVLLIVFVLYNRYSVKKNANEELKQANIIIKEEK
ncbi:MAG: tetratricopeptide repeat protein, partial [Candidatus Cloacimonetes bacterium]|nr:tetratricopeptide repeat protein [Candidatus Cloacimonadota bacterium]